MPLPLARCAFSRSSGGTSTVILRAVPMTPQHTICDTSIEYGPWRPEGRSTGVPSIGYHVRIMRQFAFCLLLALALPAAGQKPAKAPAKAPAAPVAAPQKNDEAYTAKIREYTTETFL